MACNLRSILVNGRVAQGWNVSVPFIRLYKVTSDRLLRRCNLLKGTQEYQQWPERSGVSHKMRALWSASLTKRYTWRPWVPKLLLLLAGSFSTRLNLHLQKFFHIICSEPGNGIGHGIAKTFSPVWISFEWFSSRLQTYSSPLGSKRVTDKFPKTSLAQ